MALALELEIRAEVGREVCARRENQTCGLNQSSSLAFLVG
jgi:hypothetical protein